MLHYLDYLKGLDDITLKEMGKELIEYHSTGELEKGFLMSFRDKVSEELHVNTMDCHRVAVEILKDEIIRRYIKS
jgi:hypothetical protein